MVLSLILSSLVYANSGIVTLATGTCHLLFNRPSAQKYPQVVYMGVKWNQKPLKIGDKVFDGDVLNTGNDGKIKIILSKSEQIYLGPGTSLKIEPKPKETQMDLIYGQIRSMVPVGSNPMKGKTPAAVIGVRGTDFSLIYEPSLAKTKLQVLRGKVEISDVEEKKKSLATAGQEIQVAAPKEKEQSVVLSPPKPISKESYQNMAALTQISANLKTTPKETVMAIAKVEKEALQKTLESIQKEDPELYKELQSQKIKSTEEIHERAAEQKSVTAPSEKKESKRLKDEIKLLGDEVYQ